MKKIFTLIFFNMIVFNAIHAEITWTLSDDGTLTISGTDMPNYIYSYSSTSGCAPWYSQSNKIKKVVIENSVTSIGRCAFCNCTNLNSVIIPNSVTSIGDLAFQNCYSLASVTIPNSVKTIGEQAFYGCSGLTSVTIGNSVTSIGGKVFSDCSRLTSITIPNSVTSIGGYAFNNCRGLSSVTISNSIKSITAGTFYGCSTLTSVIIPNSVMDIEYEAFCGCITLASITIPNSVTSIGDRAFDRTKWYDLQPDGLIYVGKVLYAYKGKMPSNTQINIKEGTTQIAGCAFSGCSDLSSITFPNSVTSIGGSAFSRCSGLTSIIIPNSVTSIERYAFSFCSDLTSITFPNSVTSIGGSAFVGTKWYANQPDGLIYAGKVLYGYKGTMPSNTKIDIKEGTTQIVDYAFYNCRGLSSITIPNSVKTIGDFAFQYCSGLTSITIGNSVTSIGMYAFEYCSNLASLTSEATTPPICFGKSFSDVNKSISVYVPANSVALYRGAREWNEFNDFREIVSEDQTIANTVIAKINAIGMVEYTNASKNMIDTASKAYDALTNEQKALVTNLEVLTKAQQTYEDLKAAAEKLAADKAKADAVIAKITAIGKVEYTDACKGMIDAANKAYNALTADQKALVTNLDVLTEAQQTYGNLKAATEKLAADKAKADAVIAKITAIGKVEYTDACKDKIDDASNAYNALTDDQKALVTNLDVLTKAQQTYDNLKAAAEKLAADKAVFDKYKSEIIAIIEALAKEDDSDAVKEIIRKAISDIEALGYEEVISLDDNKAKVKSFVTLTDEAVENQRAEDQKTNGIEELEFAEKYNIYDLNGRKITNSILKSGLYIRNGKKVVVK